MRHSFGSYETNFIITLTDLFAAAVSGAAIGDFTGHYFSIGWNRGKAEIWRYEDRQNRMKKSFFEDKAGYNRNSPVQCADKVKTALLYGLVSKTVRFITVKVLLSIWHYSEIIQNKLC